MRDRNSSLLIGVVAAAAAALIPLAWLQYRWIGQLSVANEERLRSHLMASIAGFRQDFMQQLGRATMEEEGLIGRMYFVRREPGGQLRLLVENEGREAEVAWPAELAEVQKRLEGGAAPGTIVDGPAPAIVLPRMRRMFRGGGRGMPDRPPEPRPGPPPGMPGMPGFGPPQMMGWRLGTLNVPMIRESLLPELAERWFTRNGEAAYFVRVVAGDKTVFENGSFAEADETSPLPGPGSAWRLEVRHKEEPLRAVVDGTRRRNLAVSFGILLALAASLLVIYVSMRRAQELARLQMEFVAGVSHELRTPLSVIVSAGDNLAEGHVTAGEQVKKYGAVIRLEGRRLAQMVEQVLSYASAESGKARLAMKPVDVRRVVEDAVQACQAEVGVSIAADVPPVTGDPTAIVRAVRNLVENALVHGGMPVTVDVTAAGNTVRIAVEDRGTGLPGEELKRLWDPFYRGRSAQEEQRPGSGLGLALVQRIAKAHGGRVEAENVSGGGARFTLSLPRAEDRKDDERAANPAG